MEERICDIAKTYPDVPCDTLLNLAKSESSMNPLKENKAGDRGLFQISRTHHPEVADDCAFDVDCATQWTAGRITEGYLSEWTSGNCYAFATVLVGKLPKMAELAPNGPPIVGSVAIFNYEGVRHLGVIQSLGGTIFTIREANYKPGLIGFRDVPYNDPHLIGFYDPRRN